MGEHDGSARNVGDNPLKHFASMIGQIGWGKKLNELSEDEVVGMILIAKSVKGLEDVYSEPYLTELFERYGGHPRTETKDIPF